MLEVRLQHYAYYFQSSSELSIINYKRSKAPDIKKLVSNIWLLTSISYQKSPFFFSFFNFE
ncbi:hypothetical protein CW752_00665 [Chryseobacterium sp. PMSZPI]|nr:hypothetical protein CW752_00665 [Chryseobacterium sp. PMSZPI]